MTKVVVIGDGDKPCACLVGPTGAEHRRLANQVMGEALQQCRLKFTEIDYVVATVTDALMYPLPTARLPN